MRQQQANYLEDAHKTPVFFQVQNAADVTPSDTGSIQTGVLYIGTGGNVKVKTRTGNIVTYKNIADGTWLPVVVNMVYTTDTTASDIIINW